MSPVPPPVSVPAPIIPPAPAPQQPVAQAPGNPPTPHFAEVFSDLAGRLVGVVVNISTTKVMAPPAKGAPGAVPSSPQSSLDDFFRDFFGHGGPNGEPIASLGSGFIIDPSGLIVTNNHVIANAEQITVTLSDHTVLQAKVIGRDQVSDLALLKV
ncbi:MAG: trypsin-like peptidase domain-containing protein, partial [Stellaceae bacterium]